LLIEWQRVLDVEDWLVESDKIVIGLTLALLRTLLVDCKVYDWRHVVENIEAVLKTDSHLVFSGFLLHPSQIVDSVGIFEI
jgi:hypothetical protein